MFGVLEGWISGFWAFWFRLPESRGVSVDVAVSGALGIENHVIPDHALYFTPPEAYKMDRKIE